MTYASGGSIQATDYNSFVQTGLPSFNSVWSTGTGKKGYGQTALAQVATGDSITAASWSNLVTKLGNTLAHQGTTARTITVPVTGDTVTYTANLQLNLNDANTFSLNAAAQGTTSANSVSFGTTWVDKLTFTHTVSFANGDAARYFFNSGGQLAITCSHPNGSGINLLLNNLAANVGTVVLSSPTSGTANIAGTSYTGITKIGGGGNTPTTQPNTGYYALTTSNANVFYQTASTGPASYLNTNINVFIKSNGTQGANQDAGSIITVYTVWDEIPNGLSASSGTNTTLTVRAPEQTYIANTWGSITLSGAVSGS